MTKLIAGLAIIWMVTTVFGTGCSVSDANKTLPCSPPGFGDKKQVEILDAFCTYGESSRFPFRFTLKNLNSEAMEVSYIWMLNDPQADEPEYQGQGSLLLPASEVKEIEIEVEEHREYDPRFYVMYVCVYHDDNQIGYYRGQKSTYDWDYNVTPPVKRTEKPPYKHIWIDTFIEKTPTGYRVNIDSIIFLPPERTARLDLNNICLSGGCSLADMLVDNAEPNDAGFHDTDNNGELTVGDYFSMNNSNKGKTIEFESRDEPSLRINKVGYRSETIEEESRDAIRIQSVEYQMLDDRTIELEVKVSSEKSLEHVDALFYTPGEGGVASSSDHLEPPVAEGDTLIYRKVIDNVTRDKGDQYLLIFIMDGTNEVLYNAGKLP